MQLERLERWLSGQVYWLFFQKILVWFPAPTWELTTVCGSSSRGSIALSRPLGSPHACGDRHKCRQYTHTHKIKTKLLLHLGRLLAPLSTSAHREPLFLFKILFLSKIDFCYTSRLLNSQFSCLSLLSARNTVGATMRAQGLYKYWISAEPWQTSLHSQVEELAINAETWEPVKSKTSFTVSLTQAFIWLCIESWMKRRRSGPRFESFVQLILENN